MRLRITWGPRPTSSSSRSPALSGASIRRQRWRASSFPAEPGAGSGLALPSERACACPPRPSRSQAALSPSVWMARHLVGRRSGSARPSPDDGRSARPPRRTRRRFPAPITRSPPQAPFRPAATLQQALHRVSARTAPASRAQVLLAAGYKLAAGLSPVFWRTARCPGTCPLSADSELRTPASPLQERRPSAPCPELRADSGQGSLVRSAPFLLLTLHESQASGASATAARTLGPDLRMRPGESDPVKIDLEPFWTGPASPLRPTR